MRTASFTGDSATTLRGAGVHSGEGAVLELVRVGGPVCLRIGDTRVAVAELELEPERDRRSTNVRAAGRRIGTVEHLFAALAGLGIHGGVELRLEGPELPLLDGGARAFVDALRSVGAGESPTEPPLEVVRAGEVAIGTSRYAFEPSAPGAPAVVVEVELDYPGAPIEPRARWEGDPADFVERIAPARTFALEAEVEALGAASLARFAEATSVIVVGAKLWGAGAVEPDEPARHKLLDLLGDCYLHGGPPRGVLRAFRPGHAANHAALRAAIGQGILRRRP